VRVIDNSRRTRIAGQLSGEIDLATAPEAGKVLLAAADEAPRTGLELDCAALTFIDASGITMLLDVVERSGRTVRLVNLADGCRRVFEVLDLCEWFGIEADDRPVALGGI
jgi:anti-anti-sigma factor